MQKPKAFEHFECSTMTDDLRAMGIVLKERGVCDVAMESTGVYWKPVYKVWEPLALNLTVGNATHMKNVPGRKTDQKDAEWIAQLHRFGLIKASFVPDGVYQRLIDKILAIGIIAEATTDMNNFKDHRSFAAWGGVAAGNNESAGKKRSKCRHGNPHMRKLLIRAANGAKQKRGSYYRSKYRKLYTRTGSANRAKVAIANRIAGSIYKVLGGANFKDIGYMRGDPVEKQVEVLVRKLKALGVDIKNENHQLIVSTRKVKADQTGIVLQ